MLFVICLGTLRVSEYTRTRKKTTGCNLLASTLNTCGKTIESLPLTAINGISGGKFRYEYVRPWEGGTLGYAANAGEWGWGWGRDRDSEEEEGKVDGRRDEGEESGRSTQLLAEESAAAE